MTRLGRHVVTEHRIFPIKQGNVSEAATQRVWTVEHADGELLRRRKDFPDERLEIRIVLLLNRTVKLRACELCTTNTAMSDWSSHGLQYGSRKSGEGQKGHRPFQGLGHALIGRRSSMRSSRRHKCCRVLCGTS